MLNITQKGSRKVNQNHRNIGGYLSKKAAATGTWCRLLVEARTSWLIICLTVLTLTSIQCRAISGLFYVEDYYAIAHTTSDGVAIQAAIDAALPHYGSSVIFQAGKEYHLDTYTTSGGVILNLSTYRSAPVSVNFVGNNAILTSSFVNSYILYIFGYFESSTIQDLNFRNLHPSTTSFTGAISLESNSFLDSAHTTGSHIHGVTITRCSFSGFSRAISLSGAQSCSITSSTFLMPNGRSSGSGSNMYDPNVGIWLFPAPMNNELQNTSNYTRNIVIANNTYDGGATSSYLGGDGFIFGHSLQLQAFGNTIRKFSFEAILSNLLERFYSDIVIANERSRIYSNVIDNSQVPPQGYGIRADVSDIEVDHNTIANVRIGLMTYNTQNGATVDIAGVSFHDNTVSVGAVPTSSQGAVGLLINGVSSSQFYNNSITCLGYAPHAPTPNGVWDGIGSYAVQAGYSSDPNRNPYSSDLHVHDNTITTQFANSGFVGMGIWSVVLSDPQTQLVNNSFTGFTGLNAYYATIRNVFPYPNNQSDNFISRLIIIGNRWY